MQAMCGAKSRSFSQGFRTSFFAALVVFLWVLAVVGSGADRQQVRANPQAVPDPPHPLQSLEQIEKEAQGCATAADAVTVYKMFIGRPDLPQDLRRAAEERLALWRDREKQGLVRVNADWITKEEHAMKCKAAQDLIAEALAFLKLGNIKMAEFEFTKASETKLDSGDAEMYLGLIDCFWHDDDLAGMKHFRESACRSATNVAASNNAAVAGFYGGRTTRIADDFQAALERADKEDAQRIADNIAFILASKKVNSRHAEQLKSLYKTALREMRLSPPEPEKPGDKIREAPYFFLPRAWKEIAKDNDKNPRLGVEADSAVHVFSGTGFVIAPHYVVTNHHVIDDAVEVTVMNPQKKEELLSAKVVASNPEVDLALLHCPQLLAPAIRLRRMLPGRGTELMSLGYPHARVLGLGIKSTRGAVVSMPENAESRFLHDAVVNPGNSGGPLVDRTGAVIGVTVAYLTRYAVDNPYFVGIPVNSLWGFLDTSGQKIAVSPSDGSQELEWPEVDAQASKSTVFIQCKVDAAKQEEE